MAITFQYHRNGDLEAYSLIDDRTGQWLDELLDTPTIAYRIGAETYAFDDMPLAYETLVSAHYYNGYVEPTPVGEEQTPWELGSLDRPDGYDGYMLTDDEAFESMTIEELEAHFPPDASARGIL